MGYGFKHGAGGGSELAFRVLSGTAAPTSPKENDIWVNTDTEITGWHFCANEPNVRVSGTVWIQTGASSPVAFNAVKKNGLMVYPLSAKQYIGGSWVVKEASIYQSGEWVQFSSYWDGYYFKDGDQYEEITGGWSSEGWDNSGTANIGETLIVSANGNATGRMGIANPVDLTNVNTLWYDSPNGNNGASNSGYLCIADAKTYGSGNRVASTTIRNAGTGSIDVSNLSGEHYLYLYAMGSSGATAYADIRAIWGE